MKVRKCTVSIIIVIIIISAYCPMCAAVESALSNAEIKDSIVNSMKTLSAHSVNTSVARADLICVDKAFYASERDKSKSGLRRKIEASLAAQHQAFMGELQRQGLIPVNNPPPQKLNEKIDSGIAGFKYYCRISFILRVWCQKAS